MNVNNVNLTATVVNQLQYPIDTVPEVAFVGRSNVGKSSLINALINRKSLARTSSEPGKTRTINFYNVEGKLYFVDLPGYGYAKLSKSEKAKWGSMIEEYLKNREQLSCILLIVDVRHDPSENDIEMYKWLKFYDYNTIVICTKTDKLSKLQVNKNLQRIKKVLQLEEGDKLIPFSAQTKQGKEDIWRVIERICFEDLESL